MANMLEGGGKTPLFSPDQLEEMGFKLVSLPQITGSKTALRS
jgi:2-methylisocitrate lyase-like PEP mutase family enzyme